jgi:hypothetical protein
VHRSALGTYDLVPVAIDYPLSTLAEAKIT